MKPTDRHAEAFWTKVAKGDPGTCWEWRGGRIAGYGITWSGAGTSRRAHRVAYQLLVGEIPEGLTLDHLCRNRACCNPAHLEPVTIAENVMRGESPPARNARKTHCPKGHPLSGDNAYVGRGKRECIKCSRDAVRALRAVRRTTKGDAA